MGKELVTIQNQPKIPIAWEYEKSVKKVKATVYKWKTLTIELANELYIAREILSNPGARTDLKKEQTWTKYCEEIGSEIHTVNNWLRRWFFQPLKKSSEVIPLPEGKYRVIYADPAWQFDNAGFEQSAEKQYPTMSTEEICNLKIQEKIGKEAVLFLWATNAMLEDALEVTKAWGFQYKTNLVWIKTKGPSIGWFTKSRHELLLIATKGEGMHPKEKPQSWFKGEVTKHSKKPEHIYQLIEQMYDGPYLEMFARQTRKGWSSWGNEI
jgi:N6-adenosine-specific RNA methylase IME4